MEKICSKCKQSLPLSEFRDQAEGLFGKRAICKVCERVNSKLYYHQNKGKVKDLVRKGHKSRKISDSERLLMYLALHPCVDCGERDPVVLEFDHVRGEKRYNILSMVSSSMSWSSILQEIKKCDVRCANCHKKIIAIRKGSYFDHQFRVVDGTIIIKNGGEIVYG